MKRLSEPVKRRIIEHLACRQSHPEAARMIADEFGVAVTPRHVRAYDPMSFQFAGSSRWSDYYHLVQKRCTLEIGNIAIAHRTYRLTILQKLVEIAMQRGDFTLARKVLEQAAKEMGNWYVR